MRRAWAIVLLLPLATAHVPNFDERGTSAAEAFRVDDPTKSWVFYDVLEAGEQHWFVFDMEAGEDLFVSINLPAGESGRPELWILRPGSDSAGPEGTPDGWGGDRVASEDDLSIEPFSPLAMRSVAQWREPAPVSGTYYLVVEGAATYSLGLGARESFTPTEWGTVPVERISIQDWAGIPWPFAVVGEVLGLAVGVYVGWRRSVRGPAMLGLAGAGVIAGTAVTTLLLATIAAFQAGPSMALAIPFLFSALALGVGVVAARAVGRWSPGTLVACAAGALVVWAGLLAGPLALLGSAAWGAWERRKAS